MWVTRFEYLDSADELNTYLEKGIAPHHGYHVLDGGLGRRFQLSLQLVRVSPPLLSFPPDGTYDVWCGESSDTGIP
jgi:hypothetical protein